jgi:hypothetical protein
MKKLSFTSLTIGPLLIILSGPHVFAEPMIDSVSGSFTNSGTVTITGSNFGTKNPAKPLIWTDFENGIVSEISNLSTGVLGKQTTSITTEGQALNSTYSVRGRPNDGGTKRQVRLYTQTVTEQRKFFISVRRKYDHPNWWDGVTNYKFLRHWPACSNGYTNFVLTVLNGSIKYTNEGTTSSTGTGASPSQPGIWVIEEYQGDHGSINIPDATFQYWRNGSLDIDVNFIGRSSEKPDLWRCFGVENYYTNNAPPPDAYVYFDDFYADTTWSRVMICDQPTFNSCTRREIQIPTEWSSGSIMFTVHQGSFPNLSSAYLYVMDANGIVNSDGYRICTDCPPSPPTNVRVN